MHCLTVIYPAPKDPPGSRPITRQPKQHQRGGDRHRRGRKADGDDDAERRKPSDAAADHQNVDKGRRQQQRHADDRQPDRRDPHREHIGEVAGDDMMRSRSARA